MYVFWYRLDMYLSNIYKGSLARWNQANESSHEVNYDRSGIDKTLIQLMKTAERPPTLTA